MAVNNINHVVITGNLTKDPELRETSGGRSVCELRVAVNSSFKVGENWETRPNYFQVNTWAGLAENCAKYLAKGSGVAVSGRLEWQKWESKDGGLNSRVVIVADAVQFLSKPSTGGQASTPSDDLKAEAATPPKVSDTDDDLPF